MAYEDFDAARAERARLREPFGFRLGGEEFECLPVPILGDELDAILTPLDASTATVEAIRRNLVDDQTRDRFNALLKRREDPIDGEAVREVHSYLMRQYAGRPTQRSNGSSGGPHTTGSNSTGNSSAPDIATASPA